MSRNTQPWALQIESITASMIRYDILVFACADGDNINIVGNLEIDTDSQVIYITLVDYKKDNSKWFVNAAGQVLCNNMIEATKVIDQCINPQNGLKTSP